MGEDSSATNMVTNSTANGKAIHVPVAPGKRTLDMFYPECRLGETTVQVEGLFAFTSGSR